MQGLWSCTDIVTCIQLYSASANMSTMGSILKETDLSETISYSCQSHLQHASHHVSLSESTSYAVILSDLIGVLVCFTAQSNHSVLYYLLSGFLIILTQMKIVALLLLTD